MRLSVIKPMIVPFLLGCLVMYLVLRATKREGFQSGQTALVAVLRRPALPQTQIPAPQYQTSLSMF
jgi:hypothetical protein